MNKVKKIISLLTIGTTFFSATAYADFSDIPKNAVYGNAIHETASLGIFTGDQNGNFNPENAVTRAEFAVLICRFLNVDKLESMRENTFSDLSAEHWAADYIATAMKKGILQGFDDRTYRPGGEVSKEQAVKMVICAIGLKKDAEKLGTYPEGYMKLAESKGLLEGIESDGEFLRKDSAVLIYNALNLKKNDKTLSESEAVYPPSSGNEDTSKENGGVLSDEVEKVNLGEGLNLKQEESDTCTACALTMLLRRLYCTNGVDYSHITETALKQKETVWHTELGLYNEIEFEGFKISKKHFDEQINKVDFFENSLAKHPEGIIIYNTETRHAVVLADCRDGVFYATDPATGMYTPLSEVFTMSGETQEEKLEKISSIWILEK